MSEKTSATTESFRKERLPAAFLQRMQWMLGEEYPAFLASYDRPRAQALRVNTLKISVEAFREQSSFRLAPVPWCPTSFYFSRSERPGSHPFHEAGMYYIQEPSAMSVAALSGTMPGEKVLDLCAAPGGKSTQLADMLQGQGLLVSNEIVPDRAKILSQNIERMGIRNAVVTNNNPAELAAILPMYFDRVIVDAPCSGEGMFRKEPQAMAMWSQENVDICAVRQQEILESAARMVKSGGFLEYSTCTFAPEEDEGTVMTFLLHHPEFHLVDLPSLLGEKMQAYGFDTGRPEWLPAKHNISSEPSFQVLPNNSVREVSCNDDIRTDNSNNAAPAAVIAGPDEASDCDQGVADTIGVVSPALVRKTIRLFPHKLAGEGHFVALLQREGSTSQDDGAIDPSSSSQKAQAEPCSRNELACRSRRSNERKAKKSGHFPEAAYKTGKDAANPLPREYQEFAASVLSVDLMANLAAQSHSTLLQRKDTLYLVPENFPAAHPGIHCLRPGLELGTLRKNRMEPAHALAMALHPEEVQQVYDIDIHTPQAAAWMRGESLPCSPQRKGWILVTIGGCAAGWGKASGGIIKNHYPKGLRRNF